jgi:hypothetical protein
MPTLNIFLRRTHLYLGIFLLPWFFIYGLSSLPFAHNEYFNKLFDDGAPQFTERFDRPYELAVPTNNEDLREFGRQVLRDNDLEGRAFGVYRGAPNQVNIYIFDFWSSTQVTYFIDEHRLHGKDSRFRLDHFLTGMHARGGFDQERFLNDAWAVLVDIVCIAIVLWIATGIYMWWLLPSTRFWGSLALGSGFLSFAFCLYAM